MWRSVLVVSSIAIFPVFVTVNSAVDFGPFLFSKVQRQS